MQQSFCASKMNDVNQVRLKGHIREPEYKVDELSLGLHDSLVYVPPWTPLIMMNVAAKNKMKN